MIIQRVPLRCVMCAHEWVGEIVGWAPANVVTASMRALRCPECGADSRHVLLRRDDQPEAAA